MNNLLALVATGAAEAAKATDGDATAKIRAAMKASYRHWMVTDEDDQFTGALEGAAHVLEPDEVERLKSELRLLQGLSAATNGIPVDFAALVGNDDEERPEPFGVLKLWDAVKEEADAPRR